MYLFFIICSYLNLDIKLSFLLYIALKNNSLFFWSLKKVPIYRFIPNFTISPKLFWYKNE